jgi:hypothetical protein
MSFKGFVFAGFIEAGDPSYPRGLRLQPAGPGTRGEARRGSSHELVHP